MKKNNNIYAKVTLILGFILTVTIGCDRNPTDEIEFAEMSKTAEVFADDFVGLGKSFFFPYADSKFETFSVDRTQGYNSSASIRIDVPNADDPKGAYAGGIFRVDGAGRNLTGYDALTFWVKSSQGVTIGEFGFGEDFYPNKYVTTLSNVSVGTSWTKVIIPIPDASKLINERGVFRYASGTQGTNGLGYTFWIDDLKFEKLGTLAHPKSAIFNGATISEQLFIGGKKTITGLTQTFSGPDGKNITVTTAPGYFTFTSSNPSVALVDESGVVEIVGVGSSIITATLGGVKALGSLQLLSIGALPSAPVPVLEKENVKSIFSDAYTAETPINFDPRFGGSTTKTSLFTANKNSSLIYSSNNFTAITFANTVDASSLTFMHVDLYVQEAGVKLEFQIRDIGANKKLETNVNNGDPTGDDKDLRFTPVGLTVNGWNSYDIPLTGSIKNQKNNLGAIILVNGPNFILDNIYFYQKPTIPTTPTTAAPTPTVASSKVISIFSDAYTNVAGSDLNPNWGQNTVVSQVPIAGNNTLKYLNLDYQGLQLGSSQNVSGMTHLHIDYYTANSTALNTYLISTGPVEKAKALSVPNTSGWVSLEIPLSNFSPVKLADIIQFKFDGNGEIYFDNIYFHN